jgi:hypothetical protein
VPCVVWALRVQQQGAAMYVSRLSADLITHGHTCKQCYVCCVMRPDTQEYGLCRIQQCFDSSICWILLLCTHAL